MHKKKIHSKVFGAKYRTMSEMEKIMRGDLKYLLCDSKHFNAYFYRALASGDKSKNSNLQQARWDVTTFSAECVIRTPRVSGSQEFQWWTWPIFLYTEPIIAGEDVPIYAPKYDIISVEAALDFIRDYPKVWDYLPDEEHIA